MHLPAGTTQSQITQIRRAAHRFGTHVFDMESDTRRILKQATILACAARAGHYNRTIGFARRHRQSLYHLWIHPNSNGHGIDGGPW